MKNLVGSAHWYLRCRIIKILFSCAIYAQIKAQLYQSNYLSPPYSLSILVINMAHNISSKKSPVSYEKKKKSSVKLISEYVLKFMKESGSSFE
jgi:hypothetical protein